MSYSDDDLDLMEKRVELEAKLEAVRDVRLAIGAVRRELYEAAATAGVYVFGALAIALLAYAGQIIPALGAAGAAYVAQFALVNVGRGPAWLWINWIGLGVSVTFWLAGVYRLIG